MGVENWKKPVLLPLLRKPSKSIEVSKIKSADFQKKLKYLRDCLLMYRKLTGLGKGIAAVQLGIMQRFAVIYTPKKLITIINPKIIKISKRKNKYPEGCMSATPIVVPLIRPVWIEFEYHDENGDLQIWKGKNLLLNRVFQHEIDHMEGIINIDKVDPKEYTLVSNGKFMKV